MKKIVLFLVFTLLFVTGYSQNFYAKTTGDLTQLSTWGTNTNGNGTVPANFTNAGYTFNITKANNTINSNWTVSNLTVNYSGGLILNDTVNVTGTIRLTTGTLNSNGFLFLDLNTGRIDGSGNGSVSGNMTIRKDVSYNRYHYLGSPLTAPFQQIADDVNSGYIFWYDETVVNVDNSYGWTNITNLNNNMQVGLGYACFFTTANTIDIQGTYNHSFQYSQNLTYTRSGGTDPESDGWHLIGNPYASALDWESNNIDKDRVLFWDMIEDGVYYWDPANNRYASYVNGVGANGGTRYIPSLQSFWVHVRHVPTWLVSGNYSATLSFDKGATTSAANPVLWKVSANDNKIIRMELSSGGHADETIVRIVDTASNSFDYDLDAYKLNNENLTPNFYSVVDGTKYSINSMNDSTSTKLIQLEYDAAFAGTYNINFDLEEFYGYDVFLLDSVGDVKEQMTINEDYEFYTDQCQDNKRFKLLLERHVVASTNTPLNTSQIKVSVNECDVTVNGENISHISIISSSGKEVYSGPGYDGFTIHVGLPGVYIIKVDSGKEPYINKIVISQ